MQYTERQVNAAILAVAKTRRPDFDSLTDEEKSSLGRSTWYWLKNVFDKLPENPSIADLRHDWDLIKEVAGDFLIEAIKYANPEHRVLDNEAIRNALEVEHLDTQAEMFMDLSVVALEAALGVASINAILDNFDNLDLDLELQKLIAREG